MPTGKKNILLISYVFPPHYGIGGRRWAKHAVELTKLGYTVHVIYAKNPFDKESLWTDMIVKNPDIVLHCVPSRYFKVLVDFNHSFFQKILYKLLILVLPLFTRGSYLDRSVFWKRTMLKKARAVISENNIEQVIATGGPFGVMYFTTLLKKHFKNIFILNDLRDPWTWGPNWGYPNLNPKRMAFEKRREYLMLKNSDMISVTSQHNIDYLKKNYPEFSDKYICIPHFFDQKEIAVSKKTSSEKIRMILYGTVYQNLEEAVERFFSFMAKNTDKFELDIYSDNTHHLSYVKKYNAVNVRSFKQIEAKELFTKFQNYDFVFLFNPGYSRDNMSTKFYEIIYSRTPVILYSEEGYVTEFFEKNNLGFRINSENFEQKLLELYKNKSKYVYNYDYDVSEYTIDKTILKIDTILKKAGSSEITLLNLAKQKQVLFTFDYELFLGSKSGTAKNCIIEPTNNILKVLGKYKIKKSLFFVDTVYLMRLMSVENDPGAEEDYELIFDQLVKILKDGHYIFPHIHPHWLEASYNKDSKQWILKDLDKYRFHNISNEERDLLFSMSINFIHEIQKKAGITYEIDAYRAGGWCIQPFSDFKPFFEKYNIKYDFSVLADFKLLNDKFYYNFLNFPKEKIYRFNSEIEKAEDNGKFTEFSITNISLSKSEKMKNKIFLKILYRLNYQNFGDGLAVMKPEEKTIMSDSFVRKSNYNIEMTSLELLTGPKLKLYRDFTDKHSYIHFITHPKMLTRHNLYCFERYLKFLTKRYALQTDYKNMHAVQNSKTTRYPRSINA